MDIHRRWLCSECHREWIEPKECFANSAPVTITGNPRNSANCPVCGSPEIQLVEYKPFLPGLDIPRDGNYKVIPFEVINSIPGKTTTDSEQLKVEGHWLGNRDPEDLIRPSIPVITDPDQPIDVKPERSSIYDLTEMD